MITIEPYESVGTIHFGIDFDAVCTTLGQPKLTTKNRGGNLVLRFEGMYITVTTDGVAEVELLPSIKAFLFGIDIFGGTSSFRKLCKLDGDPQICAGAVILLNLGISMAGFHDNDASQKSVSAFTKGRFDVLKPQMSPFVDSAA